MVVQFSVVQIADLVGLAKRNTSGQKNRSTYRGKVESQSQASYVDQQASLSKSVAYTNAPTTTKLPKSVGYIHLMTIDKALWLVELRVVAFVGDRDPVYNETSALWESVAIKFEILRQTMVWSEREYRTPPQKFFDAGARVWQLLHVI